MKKSKSRGLNAPYSLMMTPEMKDRLARLDLFGGVYVPDWLRGIIERELEIAEKKLKGNKGART